MVSVFCLGSIIIPAIRLLVQSVRMNVMQSLDLRHASHSEDFSQCQSRHRRREDKAIAERVPANFEQLGSNPREISGFENAVDIVNLVLWCH